VAFCSGLTILSCTLGDRRQGTGDRGQGTGDRGRGTGDRGWGMPAELDRFFLDVCTARSGKDDKIERVLWTHYEVIVFLMVLELAYLFRARWLWQLSGLA